MNSEDGEHRKDLLALAEQNGGPELEAMVRPHPLNSRRLTREVYQAIARQMDLPTTGTRDETLEMIEGRLEEEGYEPRNVQVRVTETELRLLLSG